LGLKLEKELTRIPHRYGHICVGCCGHICVGFLLTSFQTSPQYATVMSTKNDLQYCKKLGQAKLECSRSALVQGLSWVFATQHCLTSKTLSSLGSTASTAGQANTGDFKGLCAVTPAKSKAAKPDKNPSKKWAACCSMLQRVAACCSVLQRVAACGSVLQHVSAWCGVVQRVAAWCSVLQRVAVCCSVLHRVSSCFSVLWRVARTRNIGFVFVSDFPYSPLIKLFATQEKKEEMLYGSFVRKIACLRRVYPSLPDSQSLNAHKYVTIPVVLCVLVATPGIITFLLLRMCSGLTTCLLSCLRPA